MKKTFADIAESLNRKENKYTKALETARTSRAKNSAELMLERVSERRQALIDENDTVANPQPEEFKMGGYVPEYNTGGPVLSGTSRGLNPFTLPEITGTVDITPMAGKPGFLDILKGVGQNIAEKGPGALMEVAGATAPFMDNFAFSKYIDKVQAPAIPTLYSSPFLDTDINVNPQLAEARKAQRVLNRAIDSGNTTRGVSNNNKINAFAKRLENTGRILGDKENRETQLRNRASLMSSNVENRNTDLINRAKRDRTDFLNEREYNKYLNILNVSEDIGNINTQRLNRINQENALKVMSPLYNRFGLLDKYFPQYMSNNG